ncbi:SigE family RNA polymerase sigma factor [Micromonospora sp. NPDC048999]|uniref:SigE family RNA polymerase sigma factor n=1 Tax=Micromonospora sp. NPDC048999 TaxID=3155391 RepID=UPI0033CEB4B4
MDAFEGLSEFVRSNTATLSRLAYLLVGNHADAQDLLQSALTKSAVRWRRISGYDDPVAYVRRVMVNEATSRWRRWRRLRIDPVGEMPERPRPDDAADTVGRVVLWAALGRLTSRQRVLLVLRFYEDRSVQETADLLGCSVGTVKSQTHHALARLRAIAPELAELEVVA